LYWSWNNQKNRRNLSAYELGKQALMFESLFKEQAKKNQIAGGELKGKLPSMLTEALKPINTREEIAEVAGLSHGTIDKIKTIETTATPDVKQKLQTQEISINQAYKEKLLEIGKEKQKETIGSYKWQDESVLSTIDKTEESHNTQKQLASELNMSTGKLAMGEIVAKKAPEEVKQKVRTGKISINQAYKEVKKEQQKQEQEG